jgi:hypothetical protein
MRWLIIFSFLISFQFSFAQNYVPFPDSNATWGFHEDGWGGISDISKVVLSNQDTLINSLTYRKLFSPVNYRGALRQDIVAKKVYFVSADSAAEQLLYDFDLEVGDTVPAAYVVCYPDAWVESIDSTDEYGGVYRKVFHLGGGGLGGMADLVEGMGSMAGPLEQFCREEKRSYYLDCFNVEGTLIYWSGFPLNNCAMPVSISLDTLSLLNIYPNPATSSVTFEFPASPTFKNAELSILTITGQVVNQTSIQNLQTTIDVSGYSKGLYLFKVQTGDEVVVKKVIVK